MSSILTLLNLINDAIFVSLVNTTLQMAVLISLIALIIRVFRAKSATIRYSLWLFALFAIIALPILTPFIPRIDFTGLRQQGAADYGLDENMHPGMETDGAGELSEASDSAPSAGAARVAVSGEMDVPLINPVSIAYFIWCAGALFMLCMTIDVYGKLRKLKVSSHDVEEHTALEMLSRLKHRLGVGRTVALKASPQIHIPMSMGIFSPVIILPDGLIDDVSGDQLGMILTHELAHIRRCDYLTSLMQNMLRVVFFFHPLFHLLNRSLAREREHICDDWVIDMTQRRTGYAECIVSLLEKALHKPASIPITIAMAQRRQDIPRRIDMIVDKSRRICTNVSKKALLALLLIGCLSLPVIGGVGFVRFAGSAPTSVKAQIAFHAGRDGNMEIYVMDVDGKNQRRFTNNPAVDANVTWSPDGQRIAFTSDRDGNLEIHVMDVDGKNQRRLTNNPAMDDNATWSPDGQRIAFQSDQSGNWEIYAIDVDGKNERKLTNNPRNDLSPAWSPDGQRIAFYSNRDGRNEIYVMDADGKNQRNLTNNPVGNWRPAWSPDGQKIAFTSQRDGRSEVYVMDADGKNQRNLTNNPTAVDSHPAWSPDGQKIAFQSGSVAKMDVYIMDADGKDQRNLTNNLGGASPDWFDPAFAYAVSPAGKLKSTWGEMKALLR